MLGYVGLLEIGLLSFNLDANQKPRDIFKNLFWAHVDLLLSRKFFPSRVKVFGGCYVGPILMSSPALLGYVCAMFRSPSAILEPCSHYVCRLILDHVASVYSKTTRTHQKAVRIGPEAKFNMRPFCGHVEARLGYVASC